MYMTARWVPECDNPLPPLLEVYEHYTAIVGIFLQPF